MMSSSGYEQATSAYKTASIHGADSHTVMLKSLQFIAKKLEEAKRHRADNAFEDTFHCHERIFKVLGVLENGLPSDAVSLADEETRNATNFLGGFYQNMRTTLSTVSAKHDYEAIYTQLADSVKGLHSHMFKNTHAATEAPADIPVMGINVIN